MNNRIPMNDFSLEYGVLGPDVVKKIDAFFAAGQYILGSNVAAFEREFARYVGSKYCVGVANGLEAIQIALMGLGVAKGDEVITVSNSDVATALAIIYAGATPVFVDVDEYFHMDPALIERAITRRTKAILPVHLFGQTADMDAIISIAKKHQLAIIEDACQAHGAMYNGKKAGTFGIAGCFSFYPTKNLGAAGDAGAIVTDNKTFYKKCLMLRNRGARKRYVHVLRGINSRLDEIQAVILRHKLPRLTSMNARRRHIAASYQSLFGHTPQIKLPAERRGARHIYHQYVISVSGREKLMKFLAGHGVDSLIHYPVPIHKQQSFAEYRGVSLPKTEQYMKKILSLPIHPYMSDSQVKTVVRLVKKFYKLNLSAHEST